MGTANWGTCCQWRTRGFYAQINENWNGWQSGRFPWESLPKGDMQDERQPLCKRGAGTGKAWRNHTCRTQRWAGLQTQFLSQCWLHDSPMQPHTLSWSEPLSHCWDSSHPCPFPCSLNQLQLTHNLLQEASSPKLGLMSLLATPTVSSPCSP